MKNIYIVFGTTGEYEDRREWFVCAYQDINKAQKRVEKLNKMLGNCFSKKVSNSEVRYEIEKIIQNAKNGDKGCRIDYTGTVYDYFPLELKK